MAKPRPLRTNDNSALLPGQWSGAGEIVLDDKRLEELIPNQRIRERVIRKEALKGSIIPIVDKGFRFFAEPIRRPVFGRPVKSMNSMLKEIGIELTRLFHPEKARKLEA